MFKKSLLVFSLLVVTMLIGGSCLAENYYNITSYKYDNKGRKIEEYRYDIDGSIIEILRYSYDKNNKKTEVRFYDYRWELLDHETTIIRYKYDEQSRLIQDVEYNSFNEIVSSPYGGDIRKYFYNADGYLVKKEYYSRNSVLLWYTVYKNDAKGNILEEKYFQPNGKPTVSIANVDSVHFKYDKANRVIEMIIYDKKGAIKEDYLGYATIWRYKYDANGNKIEESHYSYDGKTSKLTNYVTDVAIYRYKYDKNGNTIERSEYGTDNKVTDDIVYHFIYDKKNNLIEAKKTNSKGQLSSSILGSDGIAIYRYEYNKDGSVIKEGYYNVNKQLMNFVKYKYDNNRNRTEEAYYGADGKLATVTSDFNVAISRYKYDAKKNLLEESSYGVDGKLINDDYNGVAIYRYKYDDNRNRIEEVRYTVDGKKEIINLSK